MPAEGSADLLARLRQGQDHERGTKLTVDSNTIRARAGLSSISTAAGSKAPSYMASNMPNWSDRTYGSRIDEFYRVPPYSGVI